MVFTSELLAIADRILGWLKKREHSDAAMFTGLIDPVYVQLDCVVRGMIGMYRPVIVGLKELERAYSDELLSRMKQLKADIMLGQQAGNELALGLNSIARENAKIKKETTSALRTKYAPAIHDLIEGFRQKRLETRPARIKTDAAACALIGFYETRKDDFASRVRDFAWQLRILVGRAHQFRIRIELDTSGSAGIGAELEDLAFYFPGSSPARDFDLVPLGEDEDGGDTVETEVPAVSDLRASDDNSNSFKGLSALELDDEEYEMGSLCNSVPLTESFEELADTIINKQRYTETDLHQLINTTEDVCDQINRGWDQLTYAYARIRLEVATK